MKNTVITLWIATIFLFLIGLWPIALFCLLIAIATTISEKAKDQRSSGEAEELERQREAERREIDMVRKSNDILLHLIQDEHREEGDR
jgi:ABC-type protease/lipase transport system fused ATPase/permease subunit